MRNLLLLLILFSGLCVSCEKNRMGGFSSAQATSSVPGNDLNPTYIHFYNIVIDSANGYSFNLPDLTEGIIDSGTLSISIRSSLPYLTAWYPFPSYFFPDGSTVTLRRVSEQPGMIVLASVGATTPPMNYFFSLSVK